MASFNVLLFLNSTVHRQHGGVGCKMLNKVTLLWKQHCSLSLPAGYCAVNIMLNSQFLTEDIEAISCRSIN